MKVSLHRTILKGFNAEFMRWRPGNEVGGILLRGFGFRFMVYRLKP
ncbi:hypothetical protein HWB51_gp082 [Mycobacterium phage Cuke]|uniref:Uncharacterized protein n=1 Tax=Mycobacterium phage Cuke TaxID=2079417 RepID=A0A2L1IWZ4_9CAUD|nr:hypothetical protein HWB51_gp082 [Mycobacterium phage Cuke]AVD99730.1 hypothetical protein SEA_CUKE_114 [Mycobacterium phage Cuke]